jgi:hypothetical protein
MAMRFALPIAILALLLVASLPSHGKAQVRHGAERHHHASSSPVATPQNQPSPVATPAETRSYTYNYYYPEKPTVPTVRFQKVTTVLLLFFTGGLWVTTILQWRIANKTLLLQFRPKLIVRNIVIDEMSNEIPRPPLIRDGSAVVGQFYISNIGETPAMITEVGCWVESSQILPMRRPYEGKDGIELQSPKILKPSESTPWRFDSITVMDSRARMIMASEAGWALYVMGWIGYLDDLKIPRRTAFCRKYDPMKARFVKVDDPDYEHQE